jgi:uroporphyrinogen-III decarboxylase
MLPFEVQAGNDITQIRKQYGQTLAIIGGIDKLALTRDKSAIDRELKAKLPMMTETGGYIAGLDHRVVVETSYENFTYFVETVRRYLGH